MTQGSNTPEEQPKVVKSTLADTDNLQVEPNCITLVNTKGSSLENPEATGQESVNKTANNNTSRQSDVVQQTYERAQVIINSMMSELSKATSDDVQGDIFFLQEIFPNYAVLLEEDPFIIYKATSVPDTMYMHESMKDPYAIEFREAMKRVGKTILKMVILLS